MLNFKKIVEQCVNVKNLRSFRSFRGTVNTASMCKRAQESHRNSPWWGNTPGNVCSKGFFSWLEENGLLIYDLEDYDLYDDVV